MPTGRIASARPTGVIILPPLTRAAQRPEGTGELWGMAHILLAEDDDQLRVFLARGLRKAGHAVDAEPDGEAALTRSRGAEYDLLLADIVMPGLDGIELARRVAARQPGIRVMFITGFAAVAMRDDRYAPSRPRVLAKPFHLRHLIEEIDALLSQ